VGDLHLECLCERGRTATGADAKIIVAFGVEPHRDGVVDVGFRNDAPR
jgi:hypothetical protein